MKKWFVTWNKLEYKEWATPVQEGYLLVIIRKEKVKYICVKAKLIMGEKGLPAFEISEEKHFPTSQQAAKQISQWKK
ncbi:MAG: hypothetical protein A3B47_00790 [Candidatus Levybacteria bacterium RIFCSPLOWO2_01_FULL_39_24]|nr:MAG: hypothetical protein A2800_02820 [Candidatus Levybacteria bacterium RIFCSPHIGHO2_01_FULL_40_16]OGH27862.1 MAG: hypothetical protein A3E12_00890 [Candidatus Levybacteria bacterium RIFCSPHIGHO2_12_FULL_39_9]OGH45917.1 MAG: hypothetical protein A3B47_00790 [Candidatus Levybacteria bacterium RIFCSPLOWO2_01_FULL_39_24]